MTNIAPNQTLVTTTVIKMDEYPEQADFYLTVLLIHESRALPGQTQMPGAEKGKELNAILSKQMAAEVDVAKDALLECEIQKISINLWRIDMIVTKGRH